MKAFLINPWAFSRIDIQFLTEVEYTGDFHQISELITPPDHDPVRWFTAVQLNRAGDTVYVDDEGLFNVSHFMFIKSYPQPLAGCGLILGTDKEGNSTSPKEIDSQWVAENVHISDGLFRMNMVGDVTIDPIQLAV